jgi:hypothetical protein
MRTIIFAVIGKKISCHAYGGYLRRQRGNCQRVVIAGAAACVLSAIDAAVDDLNLWPEASRTKMNAGFAESIKQDYPQFAGRLAQTPK